MRVANLNTSRPFIFTNAGRHRRRGGSRCPAARGSRRRRRRRRARSRGNPPRSDALEHDRAGAVAEEDERRAVLPVEDARQEVAADHERALREPAGEHPVGLRERVHEAGAAGGEVVGGRVRRPSWSARIAAGRRERHVGRHRRDDQEVDVLPVEPRLRRGRSGSGQRDVGQRLVRAGDPPFADTRALDDPLVGRVDEARELVVRDDALGH